MLLLKTEISELFPPFYATPDHVLRVSTAGVVVDACAGGCGVNGSDGRGIAAARTQGGRGVVFGGDRNGSLSGATVVVDVDGQGTSLDPSPRPPARRHGHLVYDPERDLTWLFGGSAFATADPSGIEGDCGVAGGPNECADLWRFAGATWEPMVPVDLQGTGGPPGRVLAQVGSEGGGFVVAGGAPSAVFFFPREAFTDAWRLHASSTTPPSHQLDTAYASYGDDAEQRFVALTARWCGEATDAAGDAVDVEVRVWAGGGWRPAAGLVAVAGTDCVDAAFDLDDDLAELVFVDGRVVVEVVPRLGVTGPADPVLSTTELTATAFFQP